MCMSLDIPKKACYLRFGKIPVRHSVAIGTTVRGEDIILDYDKKDRVIGMELIDHTTKPCQMCDKQCPKCGSKRIAYAPGSTNLKPIKSINWICRECLHEW